MSSKHCVIYFHTVYTCTQPSRVSCKIWALLFMSLTSKGVESAHCPFVMGFANLFLNSFKVPSKFGLTKSTIQWSTRENNSAAWYIFLTISRGNVFLEWKCSSEHHRKHVIWARYIHLHSIKLFCNGVPVRTILRRVLTFETALDTAVSEFFNICPSSQITTSGPVEKLKISISK